MLDFECCLNAGMNAQDLLMTLKIETSYRSAPSLYCEVFQEPDGSGMLCWVSSLCSKRIIQLIHDFCITYNITKETGIDDIFTNPLFLKEYKKVNPTRKAAIPKDKMPVIFKVMKEGLPIDVEYPHGLDGHEYYLTTYGKTKQEYQAWAYIPKEWGLFAELITMLIEAGNWNRGYRCHFSRCEICHNNDGVVTEIPPWIKSIQGNTNKNLTHHGY